MKLLTIILAGLIAVPTFAKDFWKEEDKDAAAALHAEVLAKLPEYKTAQAKDSVDMEEETLVKVGESYQLALITTRYHYKL